jgi:ribose transport system ATP-binding protein
MSSTVLRSEGLGKEFNGTWVLKDVDFALEAGEIHAIVGENGAGKSTLIKILSGVYQQSAGAMFMEDKKVAFDNVEQSEQTGIRTVHQEIHLVPFFKAYENIFIGSEIHKPLGITDDKAMRKKAQEAMAMMDVDLDVNEVTAYLNTAMKKVVEICKVLIWSPKVVIFDEPTVALGEHERERLLQIIIGLKEKGLSIIYVSHNLEEIMDIADRVTILRDGDKVGLLNRDEMTVEKIIRLMLGDKTYGDYQREPREIDGEERIELANATTDKLKDVSFAVKKGEVLGVAGVVGAGKTEVAKAIFGLDKLKSGKVLISGERMKPTPQNAIAKGLALVPEERQAQGIIPNFSVTNNITLTYLKRWAKKGILNFKKERNTALEYIDKLSVRTTGPEQFIRNLSGGNQQKVILGRWLTGDFEIGIFDEPTKGIDIKAKEDIYQLMDNMAKDGKSIVMMSSYLPELIMNCDRIIVLREGRIVGEFITNEDNLEERITTAMLRGNVQ